jgi:hypothetical protein
MSPGLMLVHSPDKQHVSAIIEASEDLTIVGRKVEATRGVSIDDETLSREHFQISSVEGDLFLEDLHSTNGVMLDGKMHHGTRHLLTPGTVIRAGDSVWVCVSNSNRLKDGFFIYGSEEWVGYSASLDLLRVGLEGLTAEAPVWLRSKASRSSLLKVVRALASKRGCKVQVEGTSTQEDVLWIRDAESVGVHHKNTIVSAGPVSECPEGFQVIEVPAFQDQREDRIFWFEEFARTSGVDLMWDSADVPYSLIMADFDGEPTQFECLSRALLSGLRAMEVLEVSHLLQFDIPLYTYRSAPQDVVALKTKGPSLEVLRETLRQNKGSVRATAKLFNVQRTQVYRWIRYHGIEIDEFRKT